MFYFFLRPVETTFLEARKSLSNNFFWAEKSGYAPKFLRQKFGFATQKLAKKFVYGHFRWKLVSPKFDEKWPQNQPKRSFFASGRLRRPQKGQNFLRAAFGGPKIFFGPPSAARKRSISSVGPPSAARQKLGSNFQNFGPKFG